MTSTFQTVDLNLDEEDDDDAVDDIQPDATEKIDKKGLDALIASEKSFMLAFVAPWCHHCKVRSIDVFRERLTHRNGRL